MLASINLLFSQENSEDNLEVRQYVDLLNSIEGYVFISKGESRNLTLPFARTNEVFEGESINSLTSMDWYSYNENIVSIDENGLITGNEFGEAIISAITKDNTEHRFIIFVCPTITVISPEGVIYKHQKIYNQKVKVYLTQSKDYIINCVLRDGIDVTNDVTKDGYYESEDLITDDFTLLLSEESRLNSDDVIGDSGIRIQVRGQEVSFVSDINLSNRKIIITGTNRDRVLYDEVLPSNNMIRFLSQNKGIFYINIEGISEEFKIAIR